MEKHDLMQVDKGLKKVCGIDLSKIVPDTSRTERQTRNQFFKTERNNSEKSDDEDLQGFANDIKFKQIKKKAIAVDNCDLSFSSSFLERSLDQKSFLKNELQSVINKNLGREFMKHLVESTDVSVADGSETNRSAQVEQQVASVPSLTPRSSFLAGNNSNNLNMSFKILQ